MPKSGINGAPLVRGTPSVRHPWFGLYSFSKARDALLMQ